MIIALLVWNFAKRAVQCRSMQITAWKLSKYGVFCGPYSSVFSPNTGRYGPEITYLDTFHAVNVFWKPFSAYFCPKNSIERFSWVSGALLVLYLNLFYFLCKMESIWITHLVHTQIFLKNQHFLPLDTRTLVLGLCAYQRGKECYFFGTFCLLSKWMIPWHL